MAHGEDPVTERDSGDSAVAKPASGTIGHYYATAHAMDADSVAPTHQSVG